MKDILIVNGRVITPEGLWPGGCVYVRGSHIAAVSRNPLPVPNATIIDAGGRYISPGLIDIHVHGGDGYRFSDGSLEAFDKVTQLHAR